MRIAIIHPWFPQYRREFFALLREKSLENGFFVDIYYGAAPPEVAARDDAVADVSATELPTKYFSVGTRSIGYKSLREVRKAGGYELVIVEQAVRNLETYALLINPLSRHLAFWGHGRTYTKSVGKCQERLKTLLTNRSDWFFSYTEGGAAAVAGHGFPSSSVTVVNNSIDTRSLQKSIADVRSRDVEVYKKTIGAHGRLGLFMGGLDQSKRIDFLIAAAARVAEQIPHFKLVIAGRGIEERVVAKAAEENEFIVYAGPLAGKQKALAMGASDVLMMPGRVGLVAVDSFAAGTPIVTTDWPWHAPEFEYLEHGVNAVISEDNIETYSSSVVDVLANQDQLEKLSEGCVIASKKYTVENMVNNFVQGLVNYRESFTESNV
ncbi:glycosyltransferase family 4 protein [Kocuria flava]|uniref:D-inositol 3-phosphate glycosyltransferase n=1 Tax=Kocuria flava TaxID=446860 RepID=A0ABQ0X3M7_9MICC|nr:glycosyltransferase family 4 protein [Kocuria flava]GEO92022.1 hypothetical protein KFL01_13280 [Kocuria flava]